VGDGLLAVAESPVGPEQAGMAASRARIAIGIRARFMEVSFQWEC